MRLNRYSIEFRYVPGKTLIIADSLNRGFPELDQSEKQTTCVLEVISLDEIPDRNLQIISDAMRHDREAKNLFKVLQNGWPDQKKDLPDNIKSYFSFRDTLSSEKNFILKGEHLFIPKECPSFFKNLLHNAHLGYASMMPVLAILFFGYACQKKLSKLPIICTICQNLGYASMMRRARDTIFWLGMS